MRTRQAFTLIELLIVIAIIGILIAAIAVAVTKAKEFSLRAACGNHMSQLGLAMRTFEADHGAFPVTVDASNPQVPLRSCFVPLLGYMEQKHLADMFKPTLAWYQAPPMAFGAPIQVLICPATPVLKGGMVRVETTPETSSSGKTVYTTQPRACADFAPLTGISPGILTYHPKVEPDEAQQENGAMARSPVGLRKAAAIPDGLGNTIFFGEDAGRPDLWENGRPKLGTAISGAGWASHRIDFDIHGKDFADPSKGGPCLMNCSNDNELYSFHSGGCNFLFGDRSVRFLSSAISAVTLSRAISREGGRPPEW